MKRILAKVPGYRRAACRATAIALFIGIFPAEAAPPVWELELGRSVVRIAGSVHYLREEDYPLPEMLRRAYADADTLVVEYDSAGLGQPVNVTVLTRRVLRAGRVKPAGELRRNLSTPEFTALRRLARERGYDMERLDDLRPWFAGMYVIDRELGKAGFQSNIGVDNRLLEWAREDGKPVISLESRSDQRQLFNDIPMADQVDFLIQSLQDSPRMSDAMAGMVESWRDGDLEQLEASLLDNLKRRPDEYRRFAVNRNRQWLDRLMDLPDNGAHYLVVVGAIHLLGDSSLIALLRQNGFEVRRMESGGGLENGVSRAGHGR